MEVKNDKSTVKLHGTADRERLKTAAEKFMKRVESKRKEKENERIQVQR